MSIIKQQISKRIDELSKIGEELLGILDESEFIGSLACWKANVLTFLSDLLKESNYYEKSFDEIISLENNKDIVKRGIAFLKDFKDYIEKYYMI